MRHDVGLNNAIVQRPVKYLTKTFRENLGDRIHAVPLKCVCADERGFGISLKTPHLQSPFLIERVKHQRNGGIIVAHLGRVVSRVLLDRRLTGVNEHIGKNFPRGARWLDDASHAINFLT